MTAFFLALIFVSLIAFVVGQLMLKKAMEPHQSRGLLIAGGNRLLVVGTAAMTVSFFITLGLLTRFDLSYLYPFQGLSVIFISLAAAMLLREKLTARLVVGALLISAGVALVSTS